MFLQERAKEINDCLKGLAGKANVAVWGAALHTAKLFEKTELLFYNIKTVLDMNEKKWGDYFFGWKIGDPFKADWEMIDAVVISVPNHEIDIIKILRYELQYKGDIITLYTEEKTTPFYLLHDASITEVRYLGDYKNWKDAADECTGYDDSAIISKVADSIEKVKRGEAAWERDSCLFYEQKYNYQICAGILRCALKKGNEVVTVLDIGGALGSTWFQNRNYFTELVDLEYVVAEQDHFAEYGHKNPKTLYESSYPVVIFNKNEVEKFLKVIIN